MSRMVFRVRRLGIFVCFLALGACFSPGALAGTLLRVNEPAIVPVGSEMRDVIAFNGGADISGRVTGNVVVIGGSAHVRGTAYIGGDVVCLGGSIQSEPGSLVCGSKVELGGKVGWNSLPFFSIGKLLLLGFAFKLFFSIFVVLICLFLTFMWPKQIQYAAAFAALDLVKSSLVGVLAVLLLIPLAIGFAVTLFGIPISITIVIFFFIADWFGTAVAASLVGNRLAARGSAMVQVLAGMAVLKLIHFVPFLGGMFYFILTLPGLGAILLTRFGTNKPWLTSNRPAALPKI